MSDRPRVLIVAPSIDGTDVGEAFSAYQAVEALSRHADLTVLALQRAGRQPLGPTLPHADVVTWPEPAFLPRRFERFNAMAKPYLPVWRRHVARWVRRKTADGVRFDVAHQVSPQAIRAAPLLRGLGIPFVHGPLGGSLDTPAPLAGEVARDPALIARLRTFDSVVLRYNPAIAAGLREARLVLGVGDYVRDILTAAGLGDVRFRTEIERAHGALPPPRARQTVEGRLRVLHVGRAIRTKGLRDTVRAMALLADRPGIELISCGDGPDLDACRREAAELGVAGRVTFRGKIPREEVEREYEQADVFCFPSFREPMGGVLFEAMGHGLPMIVTAYGGPAEIVTDACGIRLPVSAPDLYAHDIATALRAMADDPGLRLASGEQARRRLESFGTWDDKARRLVDTYREVLAQP